MTTPDRGTAGFRAVLMNPYVLLSFAILCWGGNFVAGRLANTDVPPVAMSFWRHLMATAMIAPFAVRRLREDLATLGANRGMLAFMTLLFVSGNTLVYFSIQRTTVINAALINAGVPVAAVFFSWLILKEWINRWQSLGIALCFAGIAIVVTRANLAVLLGLEFGLGDLFMLLAVASWALYMVLLKRSGMRLSPWTLMLVLCAGGALWLAPAYALETVLDRGMAWTGVALASLVYVALISTIVAWACWNAGTIAIGPNRASVFMCLHPVFGPALGMIFFGEMLRPYHLSGTVLVLSGVVLVARAYEGRKSESAGGER